MNINQEEFFTVESITSLGGGSTVVVLITNTVCYLIPNIKNSKWISFIASLLIPFLFVNAGTIDVSTVFLSVVNGFLIFNTAVGFSVLGRELKGKGRNFSETIDNIDVFKGVQTDRAKKERVFWKKWTW
ncbi:MAG: hypothetical protein F9K23_09855 [Bacteroidetes bacterium]|nr:MAG: hypothetical protein F9K23_09855 [Bacteroidota bacterium]